MFRHRHINVYLKMGRLEVVVVWDKFRWVDCGLCLDGRVSNDRQLAAILISDWGFRPLDTSIYESENGGVALEKE